MEEKSITGGRTEKLKLEVIPDEETKLQPISFPIMDGTEVFEVVGADADDCYFYGGIPVLNKGYLYHNRSVIYFIVSALRFQTVAVPQGATIDNAYLSLWSHNYGANLSCYFYAEDANDGSEPESSNLEALVKTTANYHWVVTISSYSYTDSPEDSFTAIIKEVVDREGWESNNSITIIGNAQQSEVTCASWDYSGNPAKAAKLYIEYTEAAPEITNAPDSNAFGILAVDTDSSTDINKFTITNNSGAAVSVTVQATDFTGGNDTWDLSDTATPGENVYGLKAGLDDDDDNFDVIVKEDAAYNTLVSGLADGATQDWGLKLYMPTSVTNYDGQLMVATVTLVATLD